MGYFTNYPKHVFLILSNEFCERFSYYGMKAILVIYMTRALGFDDSTAVAIYHAFNVVCYFTPILGAMLADGLLGKFRTILYVSMIYAVGSVVVTISAIPVNGTYTTWATFVGLTIIAFGTGGIKPCVSSFGGDQFAPDQQRQKDSFFSLFYMAINIGSLLSTIITPMIRSKVYCFDDNCYSLAFGIPAILMVVAIVLFAIGSRWYTKVPPGESIIQRMFGCIGTAIAGKCRRNKDDEEQKEHWLDYADHKYDKQFIHDVRDVLSVCWLFLPLPVFWALFDQQGSRWTLQATQLNGDFGSFVMEPDMMQFLNALLVVAFVPILESLIYPCLDYLKIPNRPLQRMGWGMIFAATAFLLAGVLQIFVDQGAPAKIGSTQVKLNFVNAARCPVDINTPFLNATLPSYTNTEEYYYVEYKDLTTGGMQILANCDGSITVISNPPLADFAEGSAYQIIVNDGAIGQFAADWFKQEKTTATPKGESYVRIYNMLSETVSVRLKSSKESEPKLLANITSLNVSGYQSLIFDTFVTTVSFDYFNTSFNVTKDVYSKNGALYTLLLRNDTATPDFDMDQLTDIPTWTINIFIQVPQYVIMTLGECLFSVSGLAFAYSQAAPSMKSILTAIWLLTVAFGNLIVVIVAETAPGGNEMAVFFIYSIVMYATTLVFIIMCMFYNYVEPRAEEETAIMSVTEGGEDEKKEGLENEGQDVDADALPEKDGGISGHSKGDDQAETGSRPTSKMSQRSNRVTPVNA